MKLSKNLLWAWRVVRPDFSSRNGFVWPFPGNWAKAGGPFLETNKTACPEENGDGLCLAKNWSGAALGGIPARSVLVCGYRPGDVLGEDDQKLRVKQAFVWALWSVETVLGDARGANLRGANLGGAYLRGANASVSTAWPDGFDRAKSGVVIP